VGGALLVISCVSCFSLPKTAHTVIYTILMSTVPTLLNVLLTIVPSRAQPTELLCSLYTQDPGAWEACGAAAGLSLGEYCALVWAGALEFEDALKVCVGGGVYRLFTASIPLDLQSVHLLVGWGSRLHETLHWQ
jgi:hypothetical protein